MFLQRGFRISIGCCVIILFILIYHQSNIIQLANVRKHNTVQKSPVPAQKWNTDMQMIKHTNNDAKDFHEILAFKTMTKKFSGGYSMQGRPIIMEEDFGIFENITGTNINLFYLFDGHNGVYAMKLAVSYLRDRLIKKLLNVSNYYQRNRQRKFVKNRNCHQNYYDKPAFELNEQSQEFKYFYQIAENCLMEKCRLNDIKEFQEKYEKIMNFELTKNYDEDPKRFHSSCYINENDTINIKRILLDEIALFDQQLCRSSKERRNYSGTTATIVVINGKWMTIANIGNSKAIIYDDSQKTIQMTQDHIASKKGEQNRIIESGGFFTYDNDFKTLGNLTITRSLGDCHLKQFLTVEPSIATIDLDIVKPKFLVIGSNGLWNTFNSTFITDYLSTHLHDAQFGTKGIVRKAFHSGSLDNISAFVVAFNYTPPLINKIVKFEHQASDNNN